jgi:capsular exopolysaccharide synthesis family protein
LRVLVKDSLVDAPGSKKRDRRIVDLSQPAAEPFRGLRLALELRGEARRGNIVAFTSAHPQEGKSTIAINYALVAAVSQRVLLLDADLRHPVLHESFGIPRTPGLVDVLGKKSALEEVVHQIPALGRVELLTAGRPVPGIGDLMSSKRMHEFLDSVADSYDVVVADTPPVLAVSDAPSIASRKDVDVAFVVDRASKRRTLVRALRELDLVGANVVGLILNREGTLARYGYGYGYSS